MMSFNRCARALFLLMGLSITCQDSVAEKRGGIEWATPILTSESREKHGTSEEWPRLWAERSLTAGGRSYLATLRSFQKGPSFQVEVYRVISETERVLIFKFSDYAFLSVMGVPATDFKVVDTNQDGDQELAWKFCTGSFCSERSGVILYDPRSRQLFRLKYDKDSSVTLSRSLAGPESIKVKDWILGWWKEWPGPNTLQEEIRLSYTLDEEGKP